MDKGNLTDTFFESQAMMLTEKARDADKAFDGNAAEAEPQRARGQSLARQLGLICESLQAGTGTAEKAGRDAQRAAEAAGALENTLKGQ